MENKKMTLAEKPSPLVGESMSRHKRMMTEVANRFLMCKKKPPLEAAFLWIGFSGGFFGGFPVIKLFFDFLYVSFYVLHRVFDAFYLRQNVCGTVGFSGEVDGI